MSVDRGHLECPYCRAFEVDRLYVATTDVDACVCGCCGSRWDQRRGSGDYVERDARSSVFLPRRS